VAAAEALIVGTWVKGAIVAGVGPAPGVEEGIARLPSLDGEPAAVFCTCDVAPGKTLDLLAAWLRRRGAEVTVGETFKRKKSLRQVPRFVDVVLEAFERAASREHRDGMQQPFRRTRMPWLALHPRAEVVRFGFVEF